MTKTALVMAEQAGIVAQRLVRAQQQLREVYLPGALTSVLVGLIDPHHLLLVRAESGIHMLRALAFVLAGVDEPLHLTGGQRPSSISSARSTRLIMRS